MFQSFEFTAQRTFCNATRKKSSFLDPRRNRFFPPSKRTPRLSPPLPYTRSCLRMANEEAIIFARVFRNGEVSGFIGDRRDVFGGIHWHLLAPFPLLRRGVSYSMTRKTCPMALAKRKSASGGALDSVLPTTCAELYM